MHDSIFVDLPVKDLQRSVVADAKKASEVLVALPHRSKATASLGPE